MASLTDCLIDIECSRRDLKREKRTYSCSQHLEDILLLLRGALGLMARNNIFTLSPGGDGVILQRATGLIPDVRRPEGKHRAYRHRACGICSRERPESTRRQRNPGTRGRAKESFSTLCSHGVVVRVYGVESTIRSNRGNILS